MHKSKCTLLLSRNHALYIFWVTSHPQTYTLGVQTHICAYTEALTNFPHKGHKYRHRHRHRHRHKHNQDSDIDRLTKEHRHRHRILERMCTGLHAVGADVFVVA